MRHTLIIIFTFIAFHLSAQTDTIVPKLIVKTNLASLIDIFTFPTVNLTIEKPINKKISLSTSFDAELYSFQRTDTVVLHNKGFKFAVEARYYPFSINKGLYIGEQVFIRHDQYSAYIPYNNSPTDSLNGYSDAVGVIRQCVGFNCIAGYQHKIFKKILFDIFIGLGGMNRKILNTDRDYSKDNLINLQGTDLLPFFTKNNMSESSGASVNITMGLRLGWKF